MTTRPAPGGTARLAGRDVARIGFGVMQLERLAADPAAAHAILRAAVDAGVNHLDTAQFYGPGLCNDLIRQALHPYADDLVIVSKVGAERVDGGLVAAQRPEQLRAQVDANLAGLGAERLDAVNVRRVDAPPGIVAEGDQVVDLDDQLAELMALREEGKIGAIGLSNVSAAQLAQSLTADIACVQNSYSVLDRASEPVLELCRAHGIAWVPFCPLGSAFDWAPSVADDPTVIAIAERLGVTPSQVGLAWLLAHDAGTLLIAGTANRDHLADNLAAGDVRLPAEAVKELDDVASAR
ncbi:MAG TPA: aldo/keto reductase [Stackebrandtia sp.]|jgi:aryl-alcohol dehydrogenase-like predicted oxidoreductase|uniref:aldo/keto reductase n=1 Tax=Stackebrandtia sp. TaxID=2023065 RepID=UPI002D5A6706|nr:aldo/keto reductase [Stackebrandtia sp.]HZE41378.1 aldo/keto reductase [Stackebrandtia sp.]